MGGGGGGGWSDGGSLGDSEFSTLNSSSKTKINDFLNSILRDEINQKDIDTINYRKSEVLRVLEEEFDSTLDLSTGGSYTKHTYVDGLSDIDFLVDLGEFSSSKIPNKEDSRKVLKQIEERIGEKWPTTDIKSGKMAVTLTFSDGIEIQVIPAFRYHSGYRIPDPNTKGWVCTYPKKFKADLTRINQKTGGKLKPVIKLTKYILANNDVKMKSYHLENLASEAFENYTGTHTPEAMVKYLLNHSKSRVLTNVGDPCGQSEFIDDYLGPKNSNKRKILARKLNRIEKRLEKAKTLEEWENTTYGN